MKRIDFDRLLDGGKLGARPLAAWGIAAFLAGLLLFANRLDFPSFYHPDEPTKVVQLRDNDRNFYHPLLLLNTAGLIHDLRGRPEASSDIVESGRLASALFTSAALSLAVMTALALAGVPGAVFVFLALGLQPDLFEIARYFKEDPALIFGLAAFCFAAVLFDRRPSRWRAAWIGMGCALALSGKYLGCLALPFGLWIVLARGPDRMGRLGGFLAGVTLTVLAVNWQILWEGGIFLKGFGGEMGRVQDRFDDTGAFHEKAWDRLSEGMSLPVLLFAALYAVAPLFRRKMPPASQWTLVLLPVAFAAVLFSASRSGGRYNAPILFLTGLCAAIAFGWIAAGLARRFPGRAGLIVGIWILGGGAILLASTGPEFLRVWTGLHSDPRLELVQVVEATPSAWLAEEYDVRLPNSVIPERFVDGLESTARRLNTPYQTRLPDLYSLQELRAMGVTHVALVWSSRRRNESETSAEKLAKMNETERTRATFYSQLVAKGELVWESRRGRPDHLCPALRLYRITDFPQ